MPDCRCTALHIQEASYQVENVLGIVPFEHCDGDQVQIGQDVADTNAYAHVEERITTMHVTIFDDQEHPDQWVQQQICDLVQVGGDESTNVLDDVMIIDVAQFLHFKVVLGVTNHGNSLSE